jgi:hypothetical protein
MGFEYAYAANDAEALSLARLTYLDMCEHSPQIVSVLYASGVSQVLVVAQPSPAWENEGETAGLMLVDEIRMRLADLRVVCLLSGVPMFALPEFQEIEVGAPMSTATDGRDPEGTRAHMQAALDNHDARYAALRGAYGGDRFVRNVDKLVADWIEWTTRLPPPSVARITPPSSATSSWRTMPPSRSCCTGRGWRTAWR